MRGSRTNGEGGEERWVGRRRIRMHDGTGGGWATADTGAGWGRRFVVVGLARRGRKDGDGGVRDGRFVMTAGGRVAGLSVLPGWRYVVCGSRVAARFSVAGMMRAGQLQEIGRNGRKQHERDHRADQPLCDPPADSWDHGTRFSGTGKLVLRVSRQRNISQVFSGSSVLGPGAPAPLRLGRARPFRSRRRPPPQRVPAPSETAGQAVGKWKSARRATLCPPLAATAPARFGSSRREIRAP